MRIRKSLTLNKKTIAKLNFSPYIGGGQINTNGLHIKDQDFFDAANLVGSVIGCKYTIDCKYTFTELFTVRCNFTNGCVTFITC